MKKFIFFIAAILCANLLFGQKVEWGSDSKHTKDNRVFSRKNSYLGKHKESYYFLHQKSKLLQLTPNEFYTIERFNKNLTLEQTGEELRLEKYKGKPCHIHSQFNLGKETYFVAESIDKKTGIKVYLLEKLNRKSLTIEFQKLLYSIKIETTVTSRSNITFTTSPDEQKLLVTECNYTLNAPVREYILRAYDNNLNHLWTEVAVSRKKNIQSKEYDKDVFFANNENVYIFSRLYSSSSTSYEVVAVFNQGKSTEVYPIKKRLDLLFNEINSVLRNNGDFVVSGFYTNGEMAEKEAILGTFYLKINGKAKKRVTNVFTPFSCKDFKLVLDSTLASPLNPPTRHYAISLLSRYATLSYLTDEGILYKIMRNGIYNPKSNGLYVFKFSPKGDLDWIRKIPINGSNLILGHYLDGKFSVMYTDHIKNSSLVNPKRSPKQVPSKKKMKRGCLMLAEFNDKGESKRKVATTFEKVRGGIDYIYQTKPDSDNFILFGSSPNETKKYLGVIHLH